MQFRSYWQKTLKPAQNGGTLPAGGQREAPLGREMGPKVPRVRPQKRLPDQCGGWKSDEVLHFSAPDTESLLEWWGCVRAPPRATFFLRERGGPAGVLVLCLSVSLFKILTENSCFLKRQNR